MTHTFGHAGDLGDIVASLPCVRAVGGAHFVISPRENGPREPMRGARYEAIRPLLEAQPYVSGVEWRDAPGEITHDLSDFRQDFKRDENLADWQARHLSLKISLEPWLLAFRSERSLGKVVFARSTRYLNYNFPWRRLIAEHNRKSIFVGTSEEHRAFQISQGCVVEYVPTKNLLELAEIIAGASLFVGNQSCPFWIAVGLGVPLIQESWPQGPNSVIKRLNAKYCLHQPFNL